MSPLQELLTVAIVLYLVECIAAVPRRAMVFRSLWLRRLHAQDVMSCPGTEMKALALKMPLPPLGTFFETHFCPISLSPDGICNQPAHYLRTAPTSSFDNRFIPFQDVTNAAVRGSVLWVNGCGFADCGNEAAAHHLSRFILKLRDLPPSKRHRRIETAIERSLDTDRVARVHQKCVDATGRLRFSCNVLFVYLFVACPVIVWARGLSATWWILIVALSPIWLLTLIDFVHAHRQLCPARTADRHRQTALFALLPLSLIRACDVITRHALTGYHPLAVSAALCQRREHKELAKSVYTDLVYPIGDDEDASGRVVQTKQWMRHRLRAAVERNMQSAGLDTYGFLAPPDRDDVTARFYCPRCTIQFEAADSECPYCPGVVLKEFIEEQEGSAAKGDHSTVGTDDHPAVTGTRSS